MSPRSLVRSIAAAGVLGLFSALADEVWARFIPDGAVLPGLAHGVMAFVLLALVLGRAADDARATRRLLLTLPASGLLISAAFYPLAIALGYLVALLVTWAAMWLALALLQRWARAGVESPSRALARGLLAAVGSGIAFWLVSGMWTDPAAYSSSPVRLACWTFAFFPGFLALLTRHPAPTSSRSDS